jgi:hypothetical protein
MLWLLLQLATIGRLQMFRCIFSAAPILLNSMLCVLALLSCATARELAVDLTPAGREILRVKLALDDQLRDNPSRPSKPLVFPLPMCTFPGGLCGAVRRDGSVAVPPHYDWVGAFAEGRAAFRLGALYGFIDENGQEVVPPRYRIVGDYKFGFAQVDVEGKSGLIDRDGKMVIAPQYGSIEPIAPDRFRVSESRRIGGTIGAENFSEVSFLIDTGGMRISLPPSRATLGIIDGTGQWVERPGTREFDREDPSIRLALRDGLWGLVRADGSWLVEPTFEFVEAMRDGLARVRYHGKYGFIDRTGQFAIAPTLDAAWPFHTGFSLTSAQQDSKFGVIDRTGAWIFRADAKQLSLAVAYEANRSSPFGWNIQTDDGWGLLDLDGRVRLAAAYDQPIQHCTDGRLVAYKNKEWLYFKDDGTPLQPSDGRLRDAACGSDPPFVLKIGERVQLVDGDGKQITPLTFDALQLADRGVWNAEVDGKWGRIGADGRWLLQPQFDYLSRNRPIAVAGIDGKRGFLNADGSWLIEPKFEAAAIRGAGTAFVTTDGRTGVLDLKDRSWTVAPRPGTMCNIPYGILSDSQGRRAILSRSGTAWIDINADRIGTDIEAGLLPFLRDGKWGLVDSTGKVVLQPIYEEAVHFSSLFRGVGWGKRGNRWCPIDRHGSEVKEIACTEKRPQVPLGHFECKVEP